jgi:hypothetical protein
MKRLATILALLLAAAPLATRAAEPQVSGSKVVKLHAQNGSHEYGTVAVKPHGDSVVVEIHVVGSPAGVSQPAHIHMGTCATLDPSPKYPLAPVLDGVSETMVKVPLATLLATPMAVNVHKSADDLKDYVACADLK